ncbi:MAG: hypothetical protein WBA46_18720 [Thermomicrobiales bacterium]
MEPSRGIVVAAVDIGTNTLKFSIARCFPDGRIETLEERNDAVRIGAGIESTGRIDPERLDRAVQTLKTFERAGQDRGARRFVGVATETLRVASNGQDLLDRIRAETAWQVRTIGGDEEARLTYLGLEHLLPAGMRATIIDIGGGSTEIIAVTDGQVESATSIAIGSGRVADRWFRTDPPGADALDAAERDARAFLADHAPILAGRGGALLLSGGNGQYIEELRVQTRLGEGLDLATIRALLGKLASLPAAEVASMLDIQVERAAVLPAGVAIAYAAAIAMQPPVVQAVPSGIRTGLIRDIIAHEGFASLAGPQ